MEVVLAGIGLVAFVLAFLVLYFLANAFWGVVAALVWLAGLWIALDLVFFGEVFGIWMLAPHEKNGSPNWSGMSLAAITVLICLPGLLGGLIGGLLGRRARRRRYAVA